MSEAFDMQDELKYLLGLIRFEKFGAITIARLKNKFAGWREAFNASADELVKIGISERLANEFLATRRAIDPDKELALLTKHDIKAILFGDPRYPAMLSEIYDPPALLFVRGTLPRADKNHVSVVGSRKMTRYGEQATFDLVIPTAKAGLVITSGLALGIDAAVHKATLEVGGTTVAVLGSGLDDEHIGPKTNLGLAHEIIARGGALISEFPIGTEGYKRNFPFRNRIISGIAKGVIVVEAAEKSGSLITARSALEQGREVFAVPGPITSPMSVGPNNLIKMGAHPVTQASDILDVLGVDETEKDVPAPQPETPVEKAVIETLSKQPTHVDAIIRATGLNTPEVTSALTLMEMKGMVRHMGGMNYVKQ